MITVIMPTYNSGKTIERAVESINKGNYQPSAILIYDDCSTDDTITKVEKLRLRYENIFIYKGRTNKGAGFARNFLLSKVSTEYVAFLDSDDYWYSDKLQKQVARIIQDHADIITCGYNIIDKNEKIVGVRMPPKNINFFKMHFANFLPTSMTIVRYKLIGANEMSSLRWRQDYAYWLKIFRKNKVKVSVIPECLGAYQRHDRNLSRNKIENVKRNYNMFRTTQNYGVTLSIITTIANIITRLFRT